MGPAGEPRQDPGTGTGSRMGLPRFWRGGGKRQESDWQNKEKQREK